MPHSRAEREAELRNTYDFIVFGGEYSIAHAALAVVDAIITGGNYTAQFLMQEMQHFGIDLATAMATANPPVTPAEQLYPGKMIFENWEQPFPGVKIPLPNKFVPYVAARRKEQALGDVVSLTNLGASNFKNYFLDINGHSGELMLNANRASGCFWQVVQSGDGKCTLQNLGNSPFKNYYLDINGHTGALMLSQNAPVGAFWNLTTFGGGKCTFQNCASSPYKSFYLDIDGHTGGLMLNQRADSGCYWRML